MCYSFAKKKIHLHASENTSLRWNYRKGKTLYSACAFKITHKIIYKKSKKSVLLPSVINDIGPHACSPLFYKPAPLRRGLKLKFP